MHKQLITYNITIINILRKITRRVYFSSSYLKISHLYFLDKQKQKQNYINNDLNYLEILANQVCSHLSKTKANFQLHNWLTYYIVNIFLV
jgi:hypothetical protein